MKKNLLIAALCLLHVVSAAKEEDKTNRDGNNKTVSRVVREVVPTEEGSEERVVRESLPAEEGWEESYDSGSYASGEEEVSKRSDSSGEDEDSEKSYTLEETIEFARELSQGYDSEREGAIKRLEEGATSVEKRISSFLDGLKSRIESAIDRSLIKEGSAPWDLSWKEKCRLTKESLDKDANFTFLKEALDQLEKSAAKKKNVVKIDKVLLPKEAGKVEDAREALKNALDGLPVFCPAIIDLSLTTCNLSEDGPEIFNFLLKNLDSLPTETHRTILAHLEEDVRWKKINSLPGDARLAYTREMLLGEEEDRAQEASFVEALRKAEALRLEVIRAEEDYIKSARLLKGKREEAVKQEDVKQKDV